MDSCCSPSSQRSGLGAGFFSTGRMMPLVSVNDVMLRILSGRPVHRKQKCLGGSFRPHCCDWPRLRGLRGARWVEIGRNNRRPKDLLLQTRARMPMMDLASGLLPVSGMSRPSGFPNPLGRPGQPRSKRIWKHARTQQKTHPGRETSQTHPAIQMHRLRKLDQQA